MLKVISGICLSMVALAGCASGEAASPKPAKPPVDAARLRAALLPAPSGMRVTYGPELGAFGSLKATRQGLEAVRKAKLERPECAGAAQLDATEPALATAPAAVVTYSAARGSITQALVRLPAPSFPEPMPPQCASYTAEVGGQKVSYKTRALPMPARGDQSRAYLTTATGGKENAQVGSVMIRRGKLITSMLVVGTQVKPKGLYELARFADENMKGVPAG